MEILIFEQESKREVSFHVLVLFADPFSGDPLVILKFGVLTLLKLLEPLKLLRVHELLISYLQLQMITWLILVDVDVEISFLDKARTGLSTF